MRGLAHKHAAAVALAILSGRAEQREGMALPETWGLSVAGDDDTAMLLEERMTPWYDGKRLAEVLWKEVNAIENAAEL
jgi:hypothetical protein